MTITIEDFIVAFGSDDIPLNEEGQPARSKSIGPSMQH